ncbi:hypothetical protein [Ignavigranum ruoffiae]|uniref:hypothetical protein n=1 Tax=Ignavigranum ruoffiae TaxID=89093 RepID=UPI0024AE0B54|nr:hypothetical protein [Ignavigranum ruoffiae]
MKKIVLFLGVVLGLSLMGPVSVNAQANSLEEVFTNSMLEIKKVQSNKHKSLKDDDYEIIAYEDIMRKRNGIIDKNHTFYATVQQYEEFPDMDMAVGLVMRNDNIDTAYYVLFPTLPDSRLMVDDNIDIYGSLQGLYSYETVMGGTKTVPVLIVHKVLVEGVDY